MELLAAVDIYCSPPPPRTICKNCGVRFNNTDELAAHGPNCKGKMQARDFSQGQRKRLAKSGKAMPGGGFPIVNKHDLTNAHRAIGRAKNPAAARAHIRERAAALHVKLGSNWKADSVHT